MRKPNGSDRLSIRHRSASKLEFDIHIIRKRCVFPVCGLTVVERDVNNGKGITFYKMCIIYI